MLNAGAVSIHVNGKAIHTEGCGRGCSEKNNGVGLEYQWRSNYANAGYLKNSFFKDSYYIGYGKRVTTGGQIHGSLGFWSGLISYPSYRKRFLLPAILPVVSFGVSHASFSVLYIPKIGDRIIPAWFFNMNIQVWGKQ